MLLLLEGFLVVVILVGRFVEGFLVVIIVGDARKEAPTAASVVTLPLLVLPTILLINNATGASTTKTAATPNATDGQTDTAPLRRKRNKQATPMPEPQQETTNSAGTTQNQRIKTKLTN